MARPIPMQRLATLPLAAAGLTGEEAQRRLGQYGPNAILEAPPHPWRALLKETLRDPMIWFLVFTGAVYLALGSRAEALTLLIAIVPLTAMDAVLHRRTQASTAGLATRLATRVKVQRDGAVESVPSEALVPGDLVLLETGDNVPADGVVIGGEWMQLDESTLTGESFPVEKRPWPVLDSPDVPGVHWMLAGTRLLTGHAQLRVVFTGKETLYASIVQAAQHGMHAITPLQQSISQLVKALLAGAALLCAVLAYVRVVRGHGWLDALVNAATLAVAALPEEFPVVFTMFLGVGVYRLARRQALVRRAVSVENIGRVTCICSDKTGTMTEGRLRLGGVLPDQSGSKDALLAAAALASRRESGDPLDVAILDAAGPPGRSTEILATFPFTEQRRRETTICRAADGTLWAHTKGTPELIMELCALPPQLRAHWLREVDRWSGEAFKVIGVASVQVPSWLGGEPDRGFSFAGLLAFTDPVREGVPQALQTCLQAGIHVVLVTGDHPQTARAVAARIGLGGRNPVLLSGDALDGFLANGNDPAKVDILARALPAQKLTLVKALQEHGHIVAVTGDGVNDVPALQAADVGIGMGRRGTRSAREASAIILLDDNFRTIVYAIAEGRQLFDNLRSSFKYLLTIHIPLVLTATLVPLVGEPVLYLPVHIVWLEAIIHPSAMLAFQRASPDGKPGASRPPPRHHFFTTGEWGAVLGGGLLLTAVLLLAYHHARQEPGGAMHARTVALAVLSLSSAAITLALGGLRTRAGRALIALVPLLTVIIIQVGAISSLLHLQPLHLDDWLLAALSAGLGALALGAPGWTRRKPLLARPRPPATAPALHPWWRPGPA